MDEKAVSLLAESVALCSFRLTSKNEPLLVLLPPGEKKVALYVLFGGRNSGK